MRRRSGKEEARRRRTSLRRLAARSCIPEGSIEGLVGEGFGSEHRGGSEATAAEKNKNKNKTKLFFETVQC